MREKKQVFGTDRMAISRKGEERDLVSIATGIALSHFQFGRIIYLLCSTSITKKSRRYLAGSHFAGKNKDKKKEVI